MQDITARIFKFPKLALGCALIVIALGFGSVPHGVLADEYAEGDEPDVPTTEEPEAPIPEETQSDPIADPTTRVVLSQSNTANNWGCDTDIPGVLDMSSSEWGACCDVHDTCYEVNNCTADSWSDVDATPCKACNDAVTTCMMTTPGPGPSLCTNPANNLPCGTYRSGPH
jgi:hypothetical protein